jgi:hypothetical protein
MLRFPPISLRLSPRSTSPSSHTKDLTLFNLQGALAALWRTFMIPHHATFCQAKIPLNQIPSQDACIYYHHSSPYVNNFLHQYEEFFKNLFSDEKSRSTGAAFISNASLSATQSIYYLLSIICYLPSFVPSKPRLLFTPHPAILPRHLDENYVPADALNALPGNDIVVLAPKQPEELTPARNNNGGHLPLRNLKHDIADVAQAVTVAYIHNFFKAKIFNSAFHTGITPSYPMPAQIFFIPLRYIF